MIQIQFVMRLPSESLDWVPVLRFWLVEIDLGSKLPYNKIHWVSKIQEALGNFRFPNLFVEAFLAVSGKVPIVEWDDVVVGLEMRDALWSFKGIAITTERLRNEKNKKWIYIDTKTTYVLLYVRAETGWICPSFCKASNHHDAQAQIPQSWPTHSLATEESTTNEGKNLTTPMGNN